MGPTRDTTQVGNGSHFLHHNIVTVTGVWQLELLCDLLHACQLSLFLNSFSLMNTEPSVPQWLDGDIELLGFVHSWKPGHLG